MSSPSIVRKATPEDEQQIWNMFRLLHQENGVFSFSEQKLNWILQRVLYPERIPPNDTAFRGFMGVIGPSSELEACILLGIGAYWYSEDYLLEEYFTFVHPKHRKSKHARALIAYSKHMSDEIGIPLLIGILSNQKTQAKIRLYKQQLPEAGAFFLYGAKSGSPPEVRA